MTWAGGLEARYQEALAAPHVRWARVDLYDRPGNLLYYDLPFTAGAVSADINRRVSRSFNFTLPESNPLRPWFPRTTAGDIDPAGLLAPYGNRIRAYAGIEYGDGSRSEFPIFTGRIDTVAMDIANGDVQVACSDLAAEVIDAKFEAPTAAVGANSVWLEWQRLIRAALADATFGESDSDQASPLVGNLTWEEDRGQALDDLAGGVGCLWWTLADGSFVLRRPPWSLPNRTPAFMLGDGAAPEGAVRSMLTGSPSVSRNGVNNAVVYASERLDGSPPLLAVARDENPDSPTYYLGNLGRVPLLIRNQAPISDAQVEYAARVSLNYAKALTQAWTNVSALPDASLELGDLIWCIGGGVRSQQVVTGFSFPLREGSPMTLNLRAYVPLAGV